MASSIGEGTDGTASIPPRDEAAMVASVMTEMTRDAAHARLSVDSYAIDSVDAVRLSRLSLRDSGETFGAFLYLEGSPRLALVFRDLDEGARERLRLPRHLDRLVISAVLL